MADVDIGRLIRGRAEVGRDEAVSQREFQSESTIVDIHASANHEHWHNGSTMGEVGVRSSTDPLLGFVMPPFFSFIVIILG